MKKINIITLGISVMLFSVSCGKDGETGPQGQNGNANVKDAGTFQFGPEDIPTSAVEFNLTCPSNLITQDIVDNGVVLCYKKSGSLWGMLNTEQSIGGYLVYFRGSIGLGEYRINVKCFTQNIEEADLSLPFVFRLVIIESSNLERYPDVNFEDYEEVARTFNL